MEIKILSLKINSKNDLKFDNRYPLEELKTAVTLLRAGVSQGYCGQKRFNTIIELVIAFSGRARFNLKAFPELQKPITANIIR